MKNVIITGLFIGLLVLAACGTAPADNGVGLPNPASVNCEKLGGTVEMQEGPDGQYGMCHLPDGRVCEEWALYRDEGCKTGTECTEDKYASCADGYEYKSWACTDGKLHQIQYFADPCLNHQGDTTPPADDDEELLPGYVKCAPESRGVQACTMDYTPVCALVDTGVRCVRAPCPMASEYKTYGNACSACADPDVYGYAPGECVVPATVDERYCTSDDQCVRQQRCCDCGVGEWVNEKYYREIECEYTCKCAAFLSEGQCIDNQCTGVAVDATS